MAASSDRNDRLRVLELYSGIGGMHWALKEAGIPFQVVQAMDVNTTANKIYQHNFPDVAISASSITKLTASQLKKWRPDAILMSPPCQPFTRVGKKQDSDDPRTQSFLHLMQLLRSIPEKPKYMLVENVKGFEVSETRRLLVEMLQHCDYTFQEFLLSPLQFGVPNARLRYYLIAKLKPSSFGFKTSDKILEDVPEEALPWLRFRKSQTSSNMQTRATAHHEATDCDRAAASPACPHGVNQHLSYTSDKHQNRCSQNIRGNEEQLVSELLPSEGEQSQSGKTTTSCEKGFAEFSSHSGFGSTCTCHPVSDTILKEQSQEMTSSCPSTESVHLANSVSVCNTVNTCNSAQTDSDTESSRTAIHNETHQASGCGCSDQMPQHCGPSWTNSVAMCDAGRNMRHCEEDDPLVCADGTCLQEYLETAGSDDYFNQFLLSDKELRMFVVMDIVHRSFRKSACFTKRYGHYVEGAGSLLQMTDDTKVVQEASEFKSTAVEHKNRQDWGEEELAILRQLRLRYFTPREVANLLCFPQEFTFPSEFSTIQCHRVLGNSLNVHVVAVLIRLMML
ncbi:hypothetical protein BaRGS_00008397 [Batillaria attramentaria]|uniref:tRNA (cytosine(38)-C(5))-methyltransferase n=1 Tax=Batillaria attramentaria TaxID=370345 RepID=A0ABD0LMH4_9CAEN